MATRRNWSQDEINILLSAYDAILTAETSGTKVNKAAIRRSVLPQLDQRSAGSYEMKMMNISAARVALYLPIIPGYKPYGHKQNVLTASIQAYEAQKAEAEAWTSTVQKIRRIR